jgi:ATP-dependent DNA helicase RecQ
LEFFMLEQAQRVLKDIFGYDSFRGRQGAIIERVANGGDALVLMPTAVDRLDGRPGGHP